MYTNFELIDSENLINQTCLFNSRPIVLNRDLAIILGDSDLALIFQQIHYWININKQNAERNMANINTYHEGRFWCFQTYEQWEKEFEWLSFNTIRNKIKKLEQLGLIISGNFNKLSIDRTKWYSIDYKKLLELQKDVLQIKLQEKEIKKIKRKEKQKIATEKFKNNKNNKNFQSTKNEHSEMPKMSISRNAKNEHFEMPNFGIAIQENNLQEINYIQDNIVSQSVIEEQKKLKDRQTDNTEDFKIELEENKNEINQIVVQIANDLFANQKTVNVNNKKIAINKIIAELKSLNKNQINKLIDYVANKFSSSSQNIKNQTKYITSIFVNAIFEKSYLLDSLQTGSSFYIPTTKIKQDNFVNYEQPKLDFAKLRELEIKSLKGEIY